MCHMMFGNEMKSKNVYRYMLYISYNSRPSLEHHTGFHNQNAGAPYRLFVSLHDVNVTLV